MEEDFEEVAPMLPGVKGMGETKTRRQVNKPLALAGALGEVASAPRHKVRSLGATSDVFARWAYREVWLI